MPFFSKIGKDVAKLVVCADAVVIGALRVKCYFYRVSLTDMKAAVRKILSNKEGNG